MLTTPLSVLPPSSMATLENWINGGTIPFAAVTPFCCAWLSKLHSSTIQTESISTQICFIRPPRLNLFSIPALMPHAGHKGQSVTSGDPDHAGAIRYPDVASIEGHAGDSDVRKGID